MGEHPVSSPTPRPEITLAEKALKWWKGPGSKFQSTLGSRLVYALSLTTDVEAFYLGSYRGAGSTNQSALALAADDEPEILPSSTHPICLVSADAGQSTYYFGET
jgi:hypothetical protein